MTLGNARAHQGWALGALLDVKGRSTITLAEFDFGGVDRSRQPSLSWRCRFFLAHRLGWLHRIGMDPWSFRSWAWKWGNHGNLKKVCDPDGTHSKWVVGTREPLLSAAVRTGTPGARGFQEIMRPSLGSGGIDGPDVSGTWWTRLPFAAEQRNRPPESGLFASVLWLARVESNHRPLPCQGRTVQKSEL